MGLWNVLVSHHLIKISGEGDFVAFYADKRIAYQIWDYMGCPIDRLPDLSGECMRGIHQRFFTSAWNDIYDFVEFVVKCSEGEARENLIRACNSRLEKENSAYRIVGGKITLITSDEEIQSVESAIEKSLPFSGVQKHLTTALSHLSDRSNPDYRNSIKESISAVESMAKHISGKKKVTLDNALKTIKQAENLPASLQAAFSKLYGYTSDADGIRHALTEESNIGHAEAKFMLVACSAFTNYLVEKTAEK